MRRLSASAVMGGESTPNSPFLREVFDRVCIGQNIDSFKSTNKFRCFRPQQHIQYNAYCDDFGPMNFACIAKYVELLDHELTAFPQCRVVHSVAEGRRALTNAVFLLGSYMMLKFGKTADEVSDVFNWLEESHIESYRDATYAPSNFGLSLHDCWLGLDKGMSLGWVQMPTEDEPAMWGKINIDEYEAWDCPLNGDLHVVVPDRFIAMRGPVDLRGKPYCDEIGYRRFAPSFYIEGMATLGVTNVFRLNEPEYDEEDFTKHGIAVHDLFFDDCTLPPPEVVEEFFRTVDKCKGVIAIHCKAGLGRTGTLIALDMMRRHGFCARSAMGWLRIMRPGSVIGDQQAFLCAMERCGGLTLPTRNRSLLARAWASVELQRFSGSAAVLARQVELGLQMRQRAAAAVAAPSSTPAAATAAS